MLYINASLIGWGSQSQFSLQAVAAVNCGSATDFAVRLVDSDHWLVSGNKKILQYIAVLQYLEIFFISDYFKRFKASWASLTSDSAAIL